VRYAKALVVGFGTALLAAVLWPVGELLAIFTYWSLMSWWQGYGSGGFGVSFSVSAPISFDPMDIDVVIPALVGFVIGAGETLRREKRQHSAPD
jgi:hypothetical protein